MTSDAEVRRLRDASVRLRTQISQESSTVANKRKRAADARSAASRSSSATYIASKGREAESAERDANAAERKRADLEKRLADNEKRLATAQGRLEREREVAQKRSLEALRRSSEQALQQFRQPAVTFAASRPDLAESPSPSIDVFLSHASEDKDSIARPLKEALEARGVSVWFDEIKIKVGQSIRLEIEKGITNARFGVVILSPSFFAKQWTQTELDALFSRKAASGKDTILPVWHKLTKDEVLAQSPLLAGIRGLNTAVSTVDEIADQIAEVVRA